MCGLYLISLYYLLWLQFLLSREKFLHTITRAVALYLKNTFQAKTSFTRLVLLKILLIQYFIQ